jgi:hypothetical protein
MGGTDLPANAISVVRGLEPSFKRCYDNAVGPIGDRVFVTWGEYSVWLAIGPTGTVTETAPNLDDTPKGVEACDLAVARGARFSPPPKNNTVKAKLIIRYSIVES